MKANRRGFTLVELLVAIGITALLAALLLTIVTQTLELWERSVSALTLENRAEQLGSRITLDWESAFARRDGRTWIDMNDGGPWRFFTQVAATSRGDTDPNTLREVAYRWSSNRLYRVEGTAIAALDSGYSWTTPAAPDPTFLLTENVLDLQMTGYRRDGTRIEAITAADWPIRVRVAFSLISEAGARRLAAVAAGISEEPVDQIYADTVRHYVRWIGINGRAW